MIAPDNPCYLCQRRALGCHSQCKDYIAYTQYQQALSQAKQDGGLDAYERDRYNKIQRRLRHGHK